MEPPHPHRLVSSREVPRGSEWLGPRERAIEAGFARPHRRQDWRRGRFAAKTILASSDAGPLSRIEIGNHADGHPVVWIDGVENSMELSISHRSEWAAAAISGDGRSIGIDLEIVEPRTERFVRDYFTDSEVRRYYKLPRELRHLYAVTVWSAKEAVLKCARTGLRRDTRSVDIDLDPMGECKAWRTFQAFDEERTLHLDGWWGRRGNLVVTLVSPRRNKL